MGKLAVFFPGIGYTVDRPLLYFSRQLARAAGYEIKLLPYQGFPQQVRGDREKMEACFHLALSQSREWLSQVALEDYEELLFVGKSVGTIVAACVAAQRGLSPRFLLYTPLPDTFTFPLGEALVFSGGSDPWVGGGESRIPALCRERNIPCVLVPGADHSLETGEVLADLEALREVLARSARFMG